MTIATFVLLFTAHLLGDFAFQTNQMVANKQKLSVLLLHTVIIAFLSALFVGKVDFAIGLIVVSHLLLDFLKVKFFPDTLRTFLCDQTLHILVLIVAAGMIAPSHFQPFFLGVRHLDLVSTFIYPACVLVSAAILIIPVGGIIISKATHRFSDEVGDALDGLTDGGKIIGYLERALVLLFLLVGHPGGIGFLVAAKSILRFGDIKDPGQRKVTEYIIIGTFLSFGWALLVSMGAQKALTLDLAGILNLAWQLGTLA